MLHKTELWPLAAAHCTAHTDQQQNITVNMAARPDKQVLLCRHVMLECKSDDGSD